MLYINFILDDNNQLEVVSYGATPTTNICMRMRKVAEDEDSSDLEGDLFVKEGIDINSLDTTFLRTKSFEIINTIDSDTLESYFAQDNL